MKNDDFIQCRETYTLVGQEERLSEDAVDINGNRFIKVACIDCKCFNHYKLTCCKKVSNRYFSPIYGYVDIYPECKTKNKDGNCKDFEHIPPKPTKPKETSFWKRLVKFF